MTTHPSSDSVRKAVESNSPYSLHYQTSSRWPLPTSYNASSGTSDVNITVLDSSFNPPTTAHLAMASAPGPVRYDALLLLLASVNADKGSSPKPGHPDTVDRVELMRLSADALARRSDAPIAGVGVATTRFPFFSDKSRALVEAISRTTEPRRIRLSWLVGWDTLERIFNPKYYAKDGSISSPTEAMREALEPFLGEDGDGSSLVVFRRGEGDASTAEEQDFLEKEVVRDYIRSGKVMVIDVPDRQGQEVSSTAVRTAVKEGRWEDVGRMTDPKVTEYIKARGLYQD